VCEARQSRKKSWPANSAVAISMEGVVAIRVIFARFVGFVNHLCYKL
jgi:hypothetical protein